MSSSFSKKPPLEFRRGADAGKVGDSTAVIDSNGFEVGITTGTITINDEIITVQTTDTLATLFTKVQRRFGLVHRLRYLDGQNHACVEFRQHAGFVRLTDANNGSATGITEVALRVEGSLRH